MSKLEFPPGFCNDSFWDANVTWNTQTPVLTECFQETVLVWIPCAILLLILPVQILKYSRSRLQIRSWSWLSLTKTVLCGILFILALLEFSHLLNKWSTDHATVSQAALIACAVKMVTMIVAILCISMHKYRGQISSLTLFLFWLVLSICEGLRFWSAIDLSQKDGAEEFIFTVHLFWLPLSLAQLILASIADKFGQGLLHGPNPNPAGTASWPNRMVFWWFNHIAYSGWKRPLVQEDMYDPLPGNRAHVNAAGLQKAWGDEMVKMHRSRSSDGKSTYSPSIWKALFRTFWKPFFVTVLLRLGTDISIFITPQLLTLLINYVQDKSIEAWKGYLFAAGLFCSTFCQAIFNNNYMHVAFRTGMRVEAALITTVYRKALTITSAVKQQSSVGEIVNLMSVDALRFYDFMSFVHFLWSAPLQVILAMYYLYNLFGVAAFAGLIAVILTFPINAVAFGKMRQIQNVQMKEKDKRIKLMNEILNGIKVLKLYAWEEPFERLILGIRNIELSMLKKAALFGALSYVVFVMTPYVVTLATFTTYLLTSADGSFGPDKVFVAISLINILRQPLAIVSPAVATAVQAKIAAERLTKFLRSDELDLSAVEELPARDTNAVVIKGGNFRWSKEDPVVLRDVSIAVPEHKLVAVVGQVGAGKSSLCSAIIGLMEKVSGTVARKGHLAYVPQQAWIQNLTVKENILFGKDMNETRYQEVIRACALTPDLESFSAGDETEIGERGANLSGGQRQRISLARAVYSDAEVIILDDPLSAVDAHVGKHIFENVIGPNGLLRGKTRILVTHGIGYLPQTDHIFVLADHTVSESGTYQQLLRNKGAFAEFLRTYLTEEDEEDLSVHDPETVSRKEQLLEELGERRSSSNSNVTDPRRSSTVSLKRVRSVLRQASKVSQSKKRGQNAVKIEDKETPTTGKLVEAEKAEIGGVKWSVYLTFIKQLSYRTSFMIFIFYGGYSAIGAAASFWLSDWSRLENPTRSQTDYQLGVYGGLGIAQLILITCHSVTMAYGRVRAGRHLHEGLLRRVMRAPMSFFDTTPLGRLVNRFSKDVDTVDVLIPSNSDLWLYFIFGTLSVMIVICVTAWPFIILMVPLAVLYFFLQRFYILTSTQLKRLQSVSRSPIFSNFQESLSGTGVIIATKQTERFIRANERLMDNNDMCFYLGLVSQRWIGVRLELLGVLVAQAAALYAVIGKGSVWGMEPNQAGLSIGYSLSVNGLLAGVLWITSELESNIVAVERIKEYSEAPQEAAWVVSSSRPPAEWPVDGKVKFNDYQTRYRPGLDLVLKGVTAQITSGEKIGIVGRTGAGKSSMTLALFRIIESTSGSIEIDSLNIADMGLHDVRSRITILPQEPVLFSGTLRMNLDPFTKYTDAEIWDALEHSHLKQFISTLPEGLQHLVVDGGENYSVGQRQLICLARALLRKTKILVLDEATAAIDLQTDDLIQHTIRDKFAECTVLTIAHRINTIMDSTRIMVLDQGRIKEFAPPAELLKDSSSIFYGLAKTANLV